MGNLGAKIALFGLQATEVFERSLETYQRCL